ncbi:MAG: signal recognition particle receptor subunit alpha, partial [Candidatus Eremiobacteraeota bacterium]|nr:signal recognition particle receptor subunit alpha [Candidatus Eremiobacteraeota bacterium]
MSWLAKLRATFGKSRDTLAGVEALGRAKKPITPECWDELEELLILADFGASTTEKIIGGLKTVAKQ